ncbi:MAG: glycosyltransferase [Candidatus Omnitrophota bacterium]
MNILQILPALEVGGVETGTIDLSRELMKRGHNVIVVSNGGKMVKHLVDMEARHIKLPVHKKSLVTIIKMIKRLRYIIQEENVDIVHARSRVPAIIAFFAARSTRANFITTAHGYYSTHLLSKVMGWGKFVIVASTIMGRHMIENFKVPHERLRFIPRGVDLEGFNFNPPDQSDAKSEYKIGIVGRITPIKGHSFFLQSIARVIRIFPKVKILIVGDAPKEKPEYRRNLELLIKKLDIERFVEFLGSRDDMPKIMSSLDLLVSSSVGQEAFGRVIIEAGASGVPVVSTRIGGVVDIIEDNKTGLLVKPGDIKEMVDAILKVLKDRNLARNLAIEARKKVEKEYNLNAMAERTIKVYEEAIDKKRILVIKLGAIGDVILSVPSLKLLRNNFPNAFISVLVGNESRHILKKCPYIDDIILYDNRSSSNIRSLVKISNTIRSKGFDMSIDLQNNKISHFIAWFSFIPMRSGYDNKKLGFLLNNGIKYLNIASGPIEEQFRILKKAGCDTSSASRRLELWPSREDFLYVDNFLKSEWIGEGQVLIGINIGGSWKTKRWPKRNIARLIDMFASKHIRVVITGAENEKALAEELKCITKSKIIDAVSKIDILQLASLIKRCKVYITGDSAPMHIASAMGVEFIALFGPTDPRRHVEPTAKAAVIKKDLACAPCYRSKCKNIICMDKISVDEIYRLVMEKIGDNKSEIRNQKSETDPRS